MTNPVAHWRVEIRGSALESTTRLILLVLATYMDAEGRAFPSVETLAIGAGLSPRATFTHLRKALDSGWLTRTARTTSRKKASYLYRLAHPAVSELSLTGAGLARPDRNSVQSSSAPRSPPDLQVVPTNKNTNKNKKETHFAPARLQVGFEATDVEFMLVWDDYPHPPGTDRHLTQRAWNKVLPSRRCEAVMDVGDFSREYREQDIAEDAGRQAKPRAPLLSQFLKRFQE